MRIRPGDGRGRWGWVDGGDIGPGGSVGLGSVGPAERDLAPVAALPAAGVDVHRGEVAVHGAVRLEAPGLELADVGRGLGAGRVVEAALGLADDAPAVDDLRVRLAGVLRTAERVGEVLVAGHRRRVARAGRAGGREQPRV